VTYLDFADDSNDRELLIRHANDAFWASVLKSDKRDAEITDQALD
jgi:hypothetical protein